MLRLLILVILLAVLIVFALSNTDLEPIWLVSFGWHLSIGTLVLGVGVVALLFGFLIGLIGDMQQRSRARRAEQHVRTLESQLVELHQRLDRLQNPAGSPFPAPLPSSLNRRSDLHHVQAHTTDRSPRYRILLHSPALGRQPENDVDAIKLGLEFTYACGLDAVKTVSAGHELFLDLKLHDIPHTVASGLSALAPLRPALTTIHASGGSEMIARSREALESAFLLAQNARNCLPSRC